MKGLDWDYQRWPFCWTLSHISTLNANCYLPIPQTVLSDQDLQTSQIIFCSLNSFVLLPSPAHLTPREAEARLAQAFFYFWRTSSLTPPTWLTVTPPHPARSTSAYVLLRVEGLQGLRATCRRLIVQTGEVQTVPDIQHKDTIKMTPFPTLPLRLKTKIKLLKSGFGLILKALPLETKRLKTNRFNEDQYGRISNLEEQLAAFEIPEKRTRGARGFLVKLRQFWGRVSESRTPQVVQIFQTMMGFKDRMRSE